MTSSQITDFLLGMTVLLAVGRGAGWLLARLRQPAVIGEILAGLALGAVVTTWPESIPMLAPADRVPLSAVANIGLAAFMFGTGLLVSPHELRPTGGPARIGLAALLLPLATGAVVAVGIVQGAAEWSFVAFLAVAFAATALPVMARLLSDIGLDRSSAGRSALAAASLADAVVWCAVAVIVTLAGAHGDQLKLMILLPCLVVLVLAARLLLRFLTTRFASRDGRHDSDRVGVLVIILIAFCAASEWLGLHFVFGAFLLGVLVPSSMPSRVRAVIERDVAVIARLLVPAYFVLAGMKVDVRMLDGGAVLLALVVTAVAIASKLVGGYAGARWAGFGRTDSRIVAVLMNTRGLTEIVILEIGRQAGILSGRVYAVMVIMALVTTAMAGPVLAALKRRRAAMGTNRDRSRTREGRARLQFKRQWRAR